MQIEEPSSPFIARINSTSNYPYQVDILTVSFSETADHQIIPVEFYVGDCANIAFENKTISKHGTYVSSLRGSIYEQYIPFETSVLVILQFQSRMSIFNESNCPASLLVFDSIGEYNFFLTSDMSTLPLNSSAEYCIQDRNFSTYITLSGNSYYYFGINVLNQMLLGTQIKYQIFGTARQFSTDTFELGCSIPNTTQSTTCGIDLVTLGISTRDTKLCILGFVPPRLDSELATQAIITVVPHGLLSISGSTFNMYYYVVCLSISVFALVLLTLCIIIYRCCKKSHRRNSRSESDITTLL